ncbi:ATPase [Devosia pacifica]|uniref:ATPase n=1 Tax=Devosia pacifica TaxID=1335967 RepID=A0A918VTH1_9HYPH|nr:AAA family ATPase [Devosia pacifica]GHA21362.1 ATPase [Devosia pacifica]
MQSVSDASQHIVLSGCSGGGKSTLLVELARRGYETVAEPGRRIVEDELSGSGDALPWVDLAAFARRAIALARHDRAAHAAQYGPVFYDRSLIDAAAALEYATGEPAVRALGSRAQYHRQVFMAPPWPELFARDDARRHDLDSAVAEYQRLLSAYGSLGYQTILLPKISVSERADFVLSHLEQ